MSVDQIFCGFYDRSCDAVGRLATAFHGVRFDPSSWQHLEELLVSGCPVVECRFVRQCQMRITVGRSVGLDGAA